MKILFPIARADTVGGAQVHVRDLAVALEKNGHKVLVLTGKQGIYNQALSKAKIDSTTCATLKPEISPLQDFQSFQFILKTILDFKPDLIAIHSSKTGILARLAGRFAKIPCIFTAHGWSFTTGIPEPNRSIYEWIEKIHAPLAQKIICVSEYDRQLGMKIGIAPDRLVTIHNGVEDISPCLRANPSLENPVKILAVARFDRQKDHPSLIAAMSNIDNARLILVGDGPDELKIKQLVERYNMTEIVEFRGFCDNVTEIMAEAQIFVLSSNWEGLPCTIVEAMRAGLPIVASDVGGVSETIEDGKTGYLIPHKNVALMHQKLTQLVQNRQLRSEMGNLGRQKYEAQFTFTQMYAKTFETYQQVIHVESKIARD